MALALRRPPWAATIAVIPALALLLTLGTWQIKRLHWKEGLLAELARAEKVADEDLPTYHDVPALSALTPPVRIRTAGKYEGPGLLLEPRTWQGRPGYHLIAPLRLDKGGIVMVNRGWISWQDAKKTASPGGRVAVTGLLRRPDRANFFVPANNAATGQWYRLDPAAMAAALVPDAKERGDVAPYTLYADGETAGAGIAEVAGVSESEPVREALRWNPPNNHLGYALFWYCMAGVLLVMYGLSFMRRSG